jgi:DNA-binding transcriptional ArsR family regulator
MSRTAISESTKTFLRTKVGGVDALEILLLLHGEPETEFSPEMVFQQVQTSQSAVSARLERLRQNGLLLRHGSRHSPLYQADLNDPARTELIARLRELYQLRRVSVIEALYEPSPAAVRQFHADSAVKRN